MTALVPALAPFTAAILLAAGCNPQERAAAPVVGRAAGRIPGPQPKAGPRRTADRREAAEAAGKFAESDATARAEFALLRHDLQAERREVGRLRDALEVERREIAAARVTDSLVAAAVTDASLLAAGVLPLVLCWLLLRRRAAEDPADALVAEVLLADAVAERPLLLVPRSGRLAADPHGESAGGTPSAAPPAA